MAMIPDWLAQGAKRFGGRRIWPELRQVHVTELLNPPHQVALKSRHHEEIELDPMSLLPAMLGVAWHEYLEKLAGEGASEQSVKIGIGGWLLLGTPDWYHDGVLRDYKTAKMWSHVFGRDEWVEQLNVYRYMLAVAGIQIRHLEIHVLYTDWTASQAGRNSDLPQTPLLVYEPPMWPMDVTRQFIMDRLVALGQQLEHVSWGEIDAHACTPEERWERGEAWAVMKPGRKRATRVFATPEAAQELAEKIDGEVQHRPGVPARCLNYCPVSQFCGFGKRLVEDNEFGEQPETKQG